MKLVLVVTDIGGPTSLHSLLSELPTDFSLPIVVLHTVEKALMESSLAALEKTLPFKVALLEGRTLIDPGTVYFCKEELVYHPIIRDSRNALVGVDGHNSHTTVGKSIDGISAAYKSELATVFLSGKGYASDLTASCTRLDQSGCAVFVLNRKETVVFDMGRRVLKNVARAKELSARQIAQELVAFSAQRAEQRVTEHT